jgi:small subunit ribosomal protein S21
MWLRLQHIKTAQLKLIMQLGSFMHTNSEWCANVNRLLKITTPGTLEAPGVFVFSQPRSTPMSIIVHANDIDRALRDLKRMIQREGVLKDLKKRRFYEKPSVKKKRKQLEAARRRRKALRYRKPERG